MTAFLHSALVDYMERTVLADPVTDDVHPLPFAALAAGVVVGLLLAALFLRRAPSYRFYDPDEYGEEWRGMKGVLLLTAVFVFMQPAVFIVRLLEERYLFMMQSWLHLPVPSSEYYSPWWKTTLLFTAGARGLEVTLAVTLVLLTVLRRRVFRWAVIVYFGVVLAASAGENFLLTQIFAEEEDAILQQNFDEFGNLLALTLVLIPYVWISRRVHATFRN